MRRLALLCVLGACRDGAPAPEITAPPPVDAAPVGELTLPAPVARVGDVVTVDAETSISAKVRLYRNGKFGGFLTLSASHKRVTSAEVQDGGRVRLTYVQNRMTDVATGAERALPVEGKTYVFDARGVIAEDGHEPPEDEDVIVRRDVRLVLAPSPLPELVAGRTLTLGQQQDVPESSLPALSTGGTKLERLGWLYKGTRRRQAVIGWTGAIEDTWWNGLALKANLVGEVILDPATGELVEATSDGPVTLEVPVLEGGKKASYVGNGRMVQRIKRSLATK